VLNNIAARRESRVISTFAHITTVFCDKQRNKRGWNPARGFQPYFMWWGI